MYFLCLISSTTLVTVMRLVNGLVSNALEPCQRKAAKESTRHATSRCFLQLVEVSVKAHIL
uniref:Uncharacterized protein n=1 Tax=Setaria viridis TaxID=4556 RepID=A0A4U6TRA0_SETVI|nr:hypothetical protein SEVIR_7G076033v2 [Setaria viridis]